MIIHSVGRTSFRIFGGYVQTLDQKRQINAIAKKNVENNGKLSTIRVGPWSKGDQGRRLQPWQSHCETWSTTISRFSMKLSEANRRYLSVSQALQSIYNPKKKDKD